ncbi:hypothetical protein DMH03_40850 [Amycolatopsis sp. WAC 01376]|nr:hypothetical protein DMH03_40850 [Amycolatopsis sp. WAC 01376]
MLGSALLPGWHHWGLEGDFPRTPLTIGAPLRGTITRIIALFAILIASSLIFAAPATAGLTPRAQFWETVGFLGDKLDKDAFGSEPNLRELGRDCVLFHCPGNWDNVISALSTTGGGQETSWLEIFEDPGFGGRCLVISPGQSVGDLRLLRRGLENTSEDWNDRISSFIVYRGTGSRPASRCVGFPA